MRREHTPTGPMLSTLPALLGFRLASEAMNIPANVRLKARSDNQAAATIIGCQPYQVPRLASVGLLSYLNPESKFAVKYCSTVSLLRLTADPKWQLNATNFLNGGGANQVDYTASVQGKKRARGLARDDVKPGAPAGTGQWMVEAMLASMAFDHTAGTFLPANVDDAAVANVLGFRKHDLPPLRRAGTLKCLNAESRRARKLHSREYILGLVSNEAWLAEATMVINQHWAEKNARKSHRGAAI